MRYPQELFNLFITDKTITKLNLEHSDAFEIKKFQKLAFVVHILHNLVFSSCRCHRGSIKLPKFILAAVAAISGGFSCNQFIFFRMFTYTVVLCHNCHNVHRFIIERFRARSLTVYSMVNSNGFQTNCSPTTVFFAFNYKRTTGPTHSDGSC